MKLLIDTARLSGLTALTGLCGVRALMRRRVLLNYRLDPELLATHLPPPFRPRLVNGFALVGLCAIRLEHLRPAFIPLPVGPSSENIAHRFAIEWTDADGRLRAGVYIPRRDTDSALAVLAGGKLFPGRHGYATFCVRQGADVCRHPSADAQLHLRVTDAHGLLVAIASRTTDHLPASSCFSSLEHASDFFRTGNLGYSPGRTPGSLDGLELATATWCIEPLEIVHAYPRELLHLFPRGALEFDSAFGMHDIESCWRPVPAPTRAPVPWPALTRPWRPAPASSTIYAMASRSSPSIGRMSSTHSTPR